MSTTVGSSSGSIRPGSLSAWVLACRPATLTAAVAPVLVGTAVAARFDRVDALACTATLLGASALQIASNLANDVFDHEKGADTDDRLGPTRAVHAGLLSPTQVRRGLLVALALAFLIGVYLVALAGWVIVAIGLLSMLSAVAYTGGPYPLGYHGWGDVFVMLFFGFAAVCGTTYVHLGFVPPLAWIAAVPMGATITNILVVNNLRDRETDAKVGKRTLAVRWGRRGALTEYFLLYAVAYATPVALWMLGATRVWVLLPLLTMPLALRNARGVLSQEGRALNSFLVASAQLVFAFGVAFSVGILLPG